MQPSLGDLATVTDQSVPRWLDRRRAQLLLVGLLVLIGIGVAIVSGTTLPTVPANSSGDPTTDVDIYRLIEARVAGGEGYYAAAIAAQAQHDYPTTPAMAVRLPTLTYLEVALGQPGMTVLIALLGAALLAAMMVRLAKTKLALVERLAALVLVAASVALYTGGSVVWFHDAWAGLLIALAVMLHRDQRWWPSLIAGIAAVSIRELAWPFLLVMAVLAWPRRRRESLAWLGTAGAFLVVYALHMAAVQNAQPALSAPSSGWFGFGGWGFILGSVSTGSVLFAVPLLVVAVVVPLALFGWLFAADLSGRVLAPLLVFVGGFLVIGRADNTYWGLLFAALLVAGVAFAPRGLALTVRAAIKAPVRAR